MIETLEQLNFIVAVGGTLLLVLIFILLYDNYRERALERLISTWGLLVAFFTTLTATILALVYSEIFGFVPCGLCWFQRIFLFPQVFILGVAIYYKDCVAARYGIALSVPGLITALYQHYLQMGGSELITCPTAGIGADCAKRVFFEFGFLTYPLLSAILFGFLIALYLYIINTNDTKEGYIISRFTQTIIR